MLRAALALAERGLHIFPCQPHGKIPATAHGCKDATSDADRVARWWHTNPHYNVGVATGERSSIFVVDVDGLDAEAELRKLEAEHGALPPTVESITARGRHIFFRWPTTQPVRNSAGAIAPGIDVRGDGGYVLAPPSIHPSGKRYCWSVNSARAFAEAPQWLLAKITSKSNGKATPTAEWRALVEAGIDDGARNTMLTRITGHLLRRYVDPHIALELMQCWNLARCRPPLPPADVGTIVNSIAAREIKRRLGHA